MYNPCSQDDSKVSASTATTHDRRTCRSTAITDAAPYTTIRQTLGNKATYSNSLLLWEIFRPCLPQWTVFVQFAQNYRNQDKLTLILTSWQKWQIASHAPQLRGTPTNLPYLDSTITSYVPSWESRDLLFKAVCGNGQWDSRLFDVVDRIAGQCAPSIACWRMVRYGNFTAPGIQQFLYCYTWNTLLDDWLGLRRTFSWVFIVSDMKLGKRQS